MSIKWIEKAAKNGTYGNIYFLFEDFFDREAFNNIRILETKKIGEEEFYVVKATEYVKNIEKTFYINDFSVMTDFMENSSHQRKSSDTLNDIGWNIIIKSKLSKEDGDEYWAQAREYQLNKIKESIGLVKVFYGKKKTPKKAEEPEELEHILIK